MKNRRSFRTMRRAEGGNAAIEFALVAPILFLLFFGIIEFGMIQFCSTVIESATNSITRMASTAYTADGDTSPAARDAYVRKLVRERTYGLIDPKQVQITTDLISKPSAVKAEECIGAPPGASQTCPCAPPATFNDANGNGICDYPELNQGAAGEIVRYRVVYPWQIFTPLFRHIIAPDSKGIFRIISYAYVKNEPF